MRRRVPSRKGSASSQGIIPHFQSFFASVQEHGCPCHTWSQSLLVASPVPSFSSLQEPSVSQCHHPNALPGEGGYSRRGDRKLGLEGHLRLHQGFCCPPPPRSLSLLPDPIRSLSRGFPWGSPQAGAAQRRAWRSPARLRGSPLPCPRPPAASPASPRPPGAVPTACSCRPPPPACTAGTPRSSTTAPGSGRRR